MKIFLPAVLFSAWLLPQGLCAQDENALGKCEKSFSEDPDREASAGCFAGLVVGDRPAAIRWLREYVRQSAHTPWAWFHLGWLTAEDDEHGSEISFHTAAALFAAQQDVDGEIQTRYVLCAALKDENIELAGLEVRHSREAAKASTATALRRAQAQLLEARYLLEVGRDLGSADELLKSAEGPLSSSRYRSLKAEWLLARGNVSLEIGRRGEARDAYRKALELADPFYTAFATYGLTRVLLEEKAEWPDRVSAWEVRETAEKALAAARAAEYQPLILRALWILEMLTTGREAEGYFGQCLSEAQDSEHRSYCQGGWARRLAIDDPIAARKLIDRSRAVLPNGDWARAYFVPGAIRALWRSGTPEEAISELDALEDLRALQTGPSQAGLFSTWSDDFYWLSGKLLESDPRNPEAVEQALRVVEQLRGRTLLDALVYEGGSPVSADSLRGRLEDIQNAIERLEQREKDLRLLAEVRNEAKEDLAWLAEQKGEIETRLRRARRGRRPVQLAEMRRSLGGDQALLSFQVAPRKDWTGDFGGGSWLVVVTRDGQHVYELPGREALRREVCGFLRGITDDSDPSCDGSISRRGETLYQDPLKPAVDNLPAGIRHLIVIPDGPLYNLPFAALRPSREAEPLGSRFQISEEPSAALWLHWRDHRLHSAAAPAAPALALGNPPVPGPDAEDPLSSLTDLPGAQREAGVVVDSLGGDSESWIGEKISEHRLKNRLKTPGLRRFGLLHFGLHAVVDDRDPERSGLWLSPGPGEDGLLTSAEIAGLPLAGEVVVLSTCRSAGGQVLRGEGTMSLARAFLEAGAQTVVGSLWPLEDDQAEELFDRFYDYLGRGRSVAGALQAAQSDRRKAGAPPVAWAGLVVLGDGEVVLRPVGRPATPRAPAWLAWAVAAGGLLLLGGLAWGYWWRTGRYRIAVR